MSASSSVDGPCATGYVPLVSAVAAIAPQLPPLRHDDRVVLPRASWADYQRLLELRGERSVPRLTYLEGRLELMSPSRTHESLSSNLGRLIEAWCTDTGLDVSPYGSWTLESKESERGAEPDECYVVGTNPEPERPDLVIEVVWTSGGIDKLDVYRKLGVREVWYWIDDHLTLYALRGESYEEISASEVLVGLDHAVLLPFAKVHPTTRAVREYRAALAAR